MVCNLQLLSADQIREEEGRGRAISGRAGLYGFPPPNLPMYYHVSMYLKHVRYSVVGRVFAVEFVNANSALRCKNREDYSSFPVSNVSELRSDDQGKWVSK